MKSPDRRRPAVFRLGLLSTLLVVVFGGCGLLASLAILTGLIPFLPTQAPPPPLAVTLPPTIEPAAVLPGSQPETPPATITPSPTAVPAPGIGETPNVTPLSSGPQLTGLPEDIPIPLQVAAGAVIGAPQNFSFLTDMTYADTLAFYQQQLAAREWVKVDYGTRIGKAGAELHYTKGERRLIVHIAGVPYVGTVVEISIQV